MATLILLSLASSMRAASWSGGMGAVMVFSLGSGGRPTVRCFWCASKSEQAYEQITANQNTGIGMRLITSLLVTIFSHHWSEKLSLFTTAPVFVSHRVKLLHLLPQHARDHPDEAPVFEFSGLLVQIGQKRPDRGTLTVHTGIPVHPPAMKTQFNEGHTLNLHFNHKVLKTRWLGWK